MVFMRRSLTLLLLLMCHAAFAQVSVGLRLNNSSYLLYEPVMAEATLRNFSGHPLVFGSNKQLTGEISFEVYGPDGRPIPAKGKEPSTLSGFLIEPGKEHRLVIHISNLHNLVNTGRYSIRAVLRHPQLANVFESKMTYFTISKGAPVWEHLIGIPRVIGERKEGERIAQRRYKVFSLFDGPRNYFYLQVDDDEYVYAIRRIGIEMSKDRPRCEIDRFSRLHILLPATPHVYSYFVFDYNGVAEKQLVYRKTTTVPELIRNPDTGEVVITGGQEAEKGVHYTEAEIQPFQSGGPAIDLRGTPDA